MTRTNRSQPAQPWVPAPIRDAARAAHTALHLEELRVPKIAGIDFSAPPPNPFASDPRTPHELAKSTLHTTAGAMSYAAKLGLIGGAAAAYGPLFGCSFVSAAAVKLREEVSRNPRGPLGVVLHLEPVAKQVALAGLRAGYEECEKITKNGVAFVPIALGAAASTALIGVPAAATTATLELTAGTAKLAKNALTPKKDER